MIQARKRRQLRLRRKRRRAAFRRLLIFGFVGVLLLPAMAIPALAAQTVGPLPSIDGLSSSNLNQDTLIYDRNGNLLADVGQQGDHRIVVPLSYISPDLIKATLAIEDRSFYKNSGIDIGGIVRAALADFSHHQITQGASTISQQLVKQVFIGPNPPQTLQRKLKEAILALQLNTRYSKNQILEMYLNTIYYGEQTYGVEAAARSYFQSNAHDLTLAQAAMLAGLPQAPSHNDPVHEIAAAKARQHQVLTAMVESRYISQAQADKAFAEKLQVYPAINKVDAPHFVDFVLQTLRKEHGIDPGDPNQHRGYRVYTSLDLKLQHQAQQIVSDQIRTKGSYYNFHDGALVSMDPSTGEVLAMVGGADYNRPGGQINMAVSPRQPGSSFKIFTYTAAIESRRFNMVTPILDEPLTFPLGGTGCRRYADNFCPYQPQNYDMKYHGTVPLKMAMGNSLNIPALKVELSTGIPTVADMARRMGVTCWGVGGGVCGQMNDNNFSMSLTLGSYAVRLVDMAAAASSLATLGVRHPVQPIVKIVDGLGHTVFSYDPKKAAVRALAPDVAFVIASIMSDDRNRCMEFGCHGDLTLPNRHVAAKTGTTQSFRDNWTVGFTPTLATAVWVGNPDNRPLNHNSTGIVGAAPIWHRFMLTALGNSPDRWYNPPVGVEASGGNYFLAGTQNLRSELAQPWPICKFTSFNPYALGSAQLLVNGVPCVLPQPKKQDQCSSGPPLPGGTPGPLPEPTPGPPGQDKKQVCPSPSPSPSPGGPGT